MKEIELNSMQEYIDILRRREYNYLPLEYMTKYFFKGYHVKLEGGSLAWKDEPNGRYLSVYMNGCGFGVSNSISGYQESIDRIIEVASENGLMSPYWLLKLKDNK